MSSYQTIETPQDYVNYTFNITSRGVTEVAGEIAGLSNTVTTILGQLAFKTSEYLTHTESLVIGLGAASVASFASATKEAIKFEQAVANVQAIGGESINAMKIGQEAMKYSSQFGMDVNSMTEGLEALSRAGLTATDVMSGVLAEGVKLSKLEGMDLEDSINNLIATTNLLSTDELDVNSQEYADAVKAMNQHIVSTSESSPINAENIIQTLQHVGGYASANNIDQEDLFAVIAQLGAKGTKGEMAGTALRAFVAAGQKDQAQRALARIGLNVSDLWDESGEAMLPISEMKEVLDSALEARGYSKQEKLEFYADFAGYKQANQIMKIDTSEVKEYKETIAQAWDLGKKLETILGTTHNNIQTLYQTTKNFLTKVGKTALPIINAIVIPLKWGVKLLDAMPFSENIVGILAATFGIKALLLLINRVVPTLASMYTNFAGAEKKAKGIRGYVHDMVEDLKGAKDILTHINDPTYLSSIRIQQGLMGEQSYKMHKEVTKEVYKDLKIMNPELPDWDDLESFNQEAIFDLMESYKKTEAYQTKQTVKTNKIKGINATLQELLLGRKSSERQSVDLKPSNTEKSTQSRLNNDNEVHKDLGVVKNYMQEVKALIDKNAKNKEQKDIGFGIMSVAHKLADVFVAAFNRDKNQSTINIDDIKIKTDRENRTQVSQEIHRLRNESRNKDLPDIGFAYNYDLTKLNNARNALIKDINSVASAFSNTDLEYINSTQRKRIGKQLDINEMSSRGKYESSLRNEAEIRDIFRKFEEYEDAVRHGLVPSIASNSKNLAFNTATSTFWVDPKDENKGIRIEQIEAFEDVLGIKNASGNRAERIQRILQEYEGLSSNERYIALESGIYKAKQSYSEFLNNRETPSAILTSHISNDVAKELLEHYSINNNLLTGTPAEQLQQAFHSLEKGQQEEIKEILYANQKRQAKGIYTESEVTQLSMMFDKLAMLDNAIEKYSSNINELAEIFHDLGSEDFKKYRKDILLGNVSIQTPGSIETPWGIFSEEREIIEAFNNHAFGPETRDDLIRQLFLDPSEATLVKQLEQNNGVGILDINEKYEDEYIQALEDIEKAIKNFDLSPITSVLEDIKKIIEKSDTSSLLPTISNGSQSNISLIINGDVVLNNNKTPFSFEDNNIIDVDSFDKNTSNLIESTPITLDAISSSNIEDKVSPNALLATVMLETLVDDIQYEIDSMRKFMGAFIFFINSLRKFASTFMLFKKGLEIIDQQKEVRAQEVIDDFNALTQGINLQWETLSIIVQSFINMFKEQENQENELNTLVSELTTNTIKFAEYLLGHSFISVENVSDELSQYVQDTIKEIIDAALNPSKSLVSIPESNGAIKDLRNKNKEDRKKGWRNPTSEKESGEEIIIGTYRVPVDDNFPDIPLNLMPRGYPKALKNQIAENRRNRMAKKDTDMQAQRYAQAKAAVDGQQAINDLITMGHNIHVELAKKHAIDPNSLTEDELDYIGLNKERNDRRSDYFLLLKADAVIAGEEKHQQDIEEAERRRKNKKGATNDMVTDRDHPTPIGPEPSKPVGDHNAAQESLRRLKERRHQQQVDAFGYGPGRGDYYAQINNIPDNLIDIEETTEQVGLTALEQAALMKKQNESLENQQKEFLQIAKTISEQVSLKEEEKRTEEQILKAEKEAKEAYDNLLLTAQAITQNIKIQYASGETLNNAEIMGLPKEALDSELKRNPQRAAAMMFDRFDQEQASNNRVRQPLSLLEREAYIATRMMFNSFERQNEKVNEFLYVISHILGAIYQIESGGTPHMLLDGGDTWSEYIETHLATEEDLKVKEGERTTIGMRGGVFYGGTEKDVNAFSEDWDKNKEDAYRRQIFWTQQAQKMKNKFYEAGKSVDDFLDRKLARFSDDPAKFGEISNSIRLFTYDLESFQDAMTKAGKVFPPFLAIAAAMEGIIGILSVVTTGLATAETILTAARMINTEVTQEEAKKEGKEAAWHMAQRIKQYTKGHKNIEKIIEKGAQHITRIGNMLIKGADKVLGIIIENIAILGPIAAAIAIAVGALWLSEQNHAKALKKATEEYEEAHKEAQASYITYKNLHEARKNEHDAMKRQQLARKESIALYKLEADRIRQLNAIKKESELRNDPLWGEYGARANYQKMSWLDAFLSGQVIGLVSKYLSGDFESQYKNYEGSTGEIRRVKEDSLGMWASGSQRAVSAWYDAHSRQLAQIEAFAPELQELYDLESRLIDRYGSKEAARNSKEFKDAVQEFADATGLNKETAEKYLDYLQTEANVENARYAMQAEVDMIVSNAQAEAYKALYGDEAGIGELDSVQDAMVYATADQIFKDAYQELWWSMLMEWLAAIWNQLTLNFGEAQKHAKAAGAYQDGMRELAENQGRITQEGVDIAKEDQRKDYENDSYTSSYGDTPFGGAEASSAAQEQDYAEEEMNRQDMYYNASKANGEAATQGFKDGLDQHSPGKIARSMRAEMIFSKEAIERGGESVMGALYNVSDATATAFSWMGGNANDAFNEIYDATSDAFNIVSDGAEWVGGTIFNALTGGSKSIFKGFSESIKKPSNVKIDNSKTEVHIHTVNINTDDDPEKIKTALMELIIEFGDLVTPKQVSRIIGTPPTTSTSSTEDTATEDENAENTENTENSNTNTNNTPTT